MSWFCAEYRPISREIASDFAISKFCQEMITVMQYPLGHVLVEVGLQLAAALLAHEPRAHLGQPRLLVFRQITGASQHHFHRVTCKANNGFLTYLFRFATTFRHHISWQWTDEHPRKGKKKHPTKKRRCNSGTVYHSTALIWFHSCRIYCISSVPDSRKFRKENHGKRGAFLYFSLNWLTIDDGGGREVGELRDDVRLELSWDIKPFRLLFLLVNSQIWLKGLHPKMMFLIVF